MDILEAFGGAKTHLLAENLVEQLTMLKEQASLC